MSAAVLLWWLAAFTFAVSPLLALLGELLLTSAFRAVVALYRRGEVTPL